MYKFHRQAKEIDQTEQKINGIVNQQNEIKTEIREINEKIELFIITFQHIVNVLRHVGQPHIARRRSYSNIDLNLPLLKFSDNNSPKVKPSSPAEEDRKDIVGCPLVNQLERIGAMSTGRPVKMV